MIGHALSVCSALFLTTSMVMFLTLVSPVVGSIVNASPIADWSAEMLMPGAVNTWVLTEARVPSDFSIAARMTWTAATP